MQKTSSIFNSKIPAAFLIALAVCIPLRFAELFLPPQIFTYRLWEALIVRSEDEILPGPFYPHQKINVTEQGDLAPYTKLSVSKKVSWETDRYGFRMRDSDLESYPVIVVGDSAILGTALDQSETFQQVLENELHMPVYSYAPVYTMGGFFKDPHIRKYPPKLVIFAVTEWALNDLINPPPNVWHRAPGKSSYKLEILKDRAHKAILLRFLIARLRGFIKDSLVGPTVKVVDFRDAPFLLPSVKSRHPETDPAILKNIIPILTVYRDLAGARGIKFIFMPIPNRDTVYHFLSQTSKSSSFYSNLLEQSRAAGIETVDLLTPYLKKAPNTLLYHRDDSHWNAEGVKLAVSEAAPVISRKISYEA